MQHAELSPYENLVTQPSCFLLIRTLKSFCYHSYLVKFNTVTSRFIKTKQVLRRVYQILERYHCLQFT